MRFEFLPAFEGDCYLIHAGTDAEPVLILVDGGPAGTYRQHLRKRLMELREARGLDEFTSLVIDLVIVSHVDDDHVVGIIDLFEEIRAAAIAGNPPPFEVRGLWHNSFDEVIGNDQVAGAAAQFGAAAFAPLVAEAEGQEAHDAGLILQSIAKGHELRDLAMSAELNMPINAGFPGLIRTTEGQKTARKIGGIDFTIVGPREDELEALQAAHDKWLEAQRLAGKPVTPGSMLLAMSDDSVPNLSSIVLLAERDGRKVLLTGDARGDFILKGLEEDGLVAPGGVFAVDLLKMPHHGSDRNVDEDFLRRIPARQYLFTGNGEYGNPERETFRMLAEARPDVEMDWYLTYKPTDIDRIRKQLYERDRDKELAKQAAGLLRAPRVPRLQWTDADNSVATLLASLPDRITIVEPAGEFVEL